MRFWLTLKDLIHLHIPDHPGEQSPLSRSYKHFLLQGASMSDQIRLHNIRFDNSLRIWIAILSFVACGVLWFGNFIPSLLSSIGLLLAYAGTEVAMAHFLPRTKRIDLLNYGLCFVDLVAISAVIILTGGAESPLYFLYFMPLIIQAFHRDWSTLLLYGIGGILSYTLIVVAGQDSISPPELAVLATRVLMMGLSVTISFLAVNLLRRKEDLERRKLSRVKFLTYVSQSLNSVDTTGELRVFLEEFASTLNTELRDSLDAWCRVFLHDPQTPYLQSIADPQHPKPELKQMLGAQTCPAFQNNKIFSMNNENTPGCPTESFDFKSHSCVPISGNLGETYGVLFAGAPKPDVFNPEEISFFQFLAKSIGLTVQRLQRMDELKNSYEMDGFAMACFMESFRNPMATHDTILEGFSHILNVEHLCLLLWDADHECLRPIRFKGTKPATLNITRQFPPGDGIPGRVLETGNPYWAYDVADPQGKEYAEGWYKAMIGLPLTTIKGEPLGVVMGCSTSQSCLFTVDDISRASTFATRAAVAIENARLHALERQDIQQKAA